MFSSLVGKARVAMHTANKAYEEKDEEKAYLLYERYARMWAHIRESAGCQNTRVSIMRHLSSVFFSLHSYRNIHRLLDG